MTQSGTGAYHEHHFRRVIPGDVETVRCRLSDALEEFNFAVLGEQPIQARRSQQKNVFACNILEYNTRVTISLRAISPVSTVATFNYEIEYLFTKGERLALEREAEAVIALATAPLKKAVCPACNTESTGAVRFCRACGTSIARNSLPAEIEVMRLTGAASGAEVEVAFGVWGILLTLAIALPMILLGSIKVEIAGWALFALGSLLSFFFLFYGMRRLHRSLSSTSQQEPQTETRAISMPERESLQPPPASVTEGTTELMDPISVRDTGDMD